MNHEHPKDEKSSLPNGKRSWGSFVVKLSIGIVALAIVLRFVDLNAMLGRIKSVEPRHFVAVCIVMLCARLLRAMKWNMLLRARGLSISMWQAIRLCFIGNFFAAWMPGSIGGDAYRVVAMRKLNQTPVVLGSIVVERYIKLLAHVILAIVTLPWSLPYLLQMSPWLLAILALASGGAIVLLPAIMSRSFLGLVRRLIPTLGQMAAFGKLESFNAGIMEYRKHPATLLIYTCLTIAEVVSYFIVNYLSAVAIGLGAYFPHFLVAMPLAHLVLQYPVSIQALGIQEAAFTTALIAMGFTAADGTAISLVQRVAEWVSSILPGVFLFVLTGSDRAKTDPANAQQPEAATHIS